MKNPNFDSYYFQHNKTHAKIQPPPYKTKFQNPQMIGKIRISKNNCYPNPPNPPNLSSIHHNNHIITKPTKNLIEEIGRKVWFTWSSWHKNLKTLKIFSICRPENNDWRRERVDGGLIGEDFDQITNISCFRIYKNTPNKFISSLTAGLLQFRHRWSQFPVPIKNIYVK